MAAIYIRHGADEHTPGRTSKHDTPLTPEGKAEAKKTALELTTLFGTPAEIVCSPYMRARQTAEQMVKALDACVPIVIDPNLSRFVSSKNRRELDVRSDTLQFAPPIQETGHDFRQRVTDHYERHVVSGTSRSARVVWYLTHGIFVREVASTCCQLRTPDKVGSCGWINATAREASWSRHHHHHHRASSLHDKTSSPSRAESVSDPSAIVSALVANRGLSWLNRSGHTVPLSSFVPAAVKSHPAYTTGTLEHHDNLDTPSAASHDNHASVVQLKHPHGKDKSDHHHHHHKHHSRSKEHKHQSHSKDRDHKKHGHPKDDHTHVSHAKKEHKTRHGKHSHSPHASSNKKHETLRGRKLARPSGDPHDHRATPVSAQPLIVPPSCPRFPLDR